VRLRIMTYNIHRAIGVDRRFRPDRIVRIAEHHAPDVLLLQEVDQGVPRSRERDLGRDLAEALGFRYFVVGHNVSLRRGRYGNATLSRYPILRERNIDLTIGSRKRRGCQHTTIKIEKVRGHPHKIDVFNLHLGLLAQERVRQIGLLVRSKEFSDLDPSTTGDRCCIRYSRRSCNLDALPREATITMTRSPPTRHSPQGVGSIAFTTGDRCAR